MNIHGVVEFYSNAKLVSFESSVFADVNVFTLKYYENLINLIDDNYKQYPLLYAIIKIYKTPTTLWRHISKSKMISRPKYKIVLRCQYDRFVKMVEKYEEDNFYLLTIE